MVGSIQDRVDYQWNGAAHGSTSWRSGQTTSGGRVASFNEFGLNITSLNGMGLPDMENVLEPAYAGGNFYQRTRVTGRTITITADVFGENIQESNRKLADLEQYLTNILRDFNQPVKLRLSIVDGNYVSDTIEAQVFYKDGLTRQLDVLEQTQLTLQFEMASPWFQADMNHAVNCNYQVDSGTLATHLWRRNLITGVWDDFAVVAGANELIYCLYDSPDGCLYMGGSFTTINGVANCNNIGFYDPADNLWHEMTNGVNNSVYCISSDPDFGDILVGGIFLQVGAAVACQAKFAAWRRGVGWTAFNAGATNGDVLCIGVRQVTTADYIFIGGAFTTFNGVATNRICVVVFSSSLHTYSAGAAIGAGMNNTVRVIKNYSQLYHTYEITPYYSGVIVGGDFTTADGVTVNRICTMNAGSTTFYALGQGFGAGETYDIHYNDNVKVLYAFGSWVLDSLGNTVNCMAYFNGLLWNALPPGVSKTGAGDQIKKASYSKREGLLLSFGYDTIVGSLIKPPATGMRITKSGGIIPWDEFQETGVNAYNIAQYYKHYLIKWALSLGAASKISASNVIVVNSKYPVRPFFVFFNNSVSMKIIFTIRSYTTGQIIFPSINIFSQEQIILDLRNDRVTAMSYVPGFEPCDRLSEFFFPSDFSFILKPGINNINMLAWGAADPGLEIHIGWQDQYRSISLP